MQTWVAISLLAGQGIFLLIGWRMVNRYGEYVDVVIATHRQNLKIRENLAIQENSIAIAHIHRRHDDPPLDPQLDEEKEA